MRLTYDPAKNERNVVVRGLPFSSAEDLDWTTALIVEDTRQAYPDRRFQVLSLIGERPHRWYSRHAPTPCT